MVYFLFLLLDNTFSNYALGTNGNYYIPSGLENQFKDPIKVNNITDIPKFDKNDNIKTTIEEKPSIDLYYNGALNLNVINIECRLYHIMNDCLHQSGCGWCQGNNKCIKGDKDKPYEDCPQGLYKFSFDIPNNDNKEEVVITNNDKQYIVTNL